jgi:hypothetical protein
MRYLTGDPNNSRVIHYQLICLYKRRRRNNLRINTLILIALILFSLKRTMVGIVFRMLALAVGATQCRFPTLMRNNRTNISYSIQLLPLLQH